MGALCWVVIQPLAFAQAFAGDDAAAATREQRRQEQRIDAIRQQQEKPTTVRGPQAASALVERLPIAEQPCFQISQFRIEGDIDAAQWLGEAAAGAMGDDGPQGRCLGTQGLNLLLKRMQNALVAKGLITTRVGVAPDRKSVV